MKKNDQKPEWSPPGKDERFAGRIVGGVAGGHDGLDRENSSAASGQKRRKLDEDAYVNGVLKGDRTILARTITLIESNAPDHIELGQKVLNQLLSHSGSSIRIGISGMPGAGKSTFIETFGLHLISRGHKVAVLAIDPSSSISRGSILGDKTRMEALSRKKESFIRPSPSSGTLGGVARKTRETILVCEAAGFDTILVETIGVGQSEITVRSMVDFFVLLQIAGAGDELQGIKRGIMELADLILVNKADGENIHRALAAKKDLETALHYMTPATSGWQTPVHTCSALNGEGIPEIFATIGEFRSHSEKTGVFNQRRQMQAREWLHSLLQEQVMDVFLKDDRLKARIDEMEKNVLDDKITTTQAARRLITLFLDHIKKG